MLVKIINIPAKKKKNVFEFWPDCWKTKHCPPSPQAGQLVINFSPLFWQLIFTWELKKISIQCCCCLRGFHHLQKRARAGKMHWLAEKMPQLHLKKENKSFLTALQHLRLEKSTDVKVEEINLPWSVTKPTWIHLQPGTLHTPLYVHLHFWCRRVQHMVSILRHPRVIPLWTQYTCIPNTVYADICVWYKFFPVTVSWEKNVFNAR